MKQNRNYNCGNGNSKKMHNNYLNILLNKVFNFLILNFAEVK